MRFLLGMVVSAALLLVVVYYVGGVKGWDPSQQGRDVRAKIAPGMSWKKVFDSTGDPKKYRPVIKKTERIEGEDHEYFVPGPANAFRRARIEERLVEDSLPYGFLSTFVFSSSVAFTVKFDGAGNVEYVEDATTMADMLQLND
jgi:hypothetical protein